MNVVERCGWILGFPLGLFTGTISFIRRARMFHPRGILIQATVENLAPDLIKLHPHAMMRFSSALWKNKIWPDVLGLTLRFSREENFSVNPLKDDQDLLFASFKHPGRHRSDLFSQFTRTFSPTYILQSRLLSTGMKFTFFE